MYMEYKIITKDEIETIELAQNFEAEKFPNMIICLDGELGSGKTMFTKGIWIFSSGSAASSYFSSEITSLGKVISLCKAFSTKNFETFNFINSGSDFSYTKEQIYDVYLQSLMWAEAVLRAIGVRSVLAA